MSQRAIIDSILAIFSKTANSVRVATMPTQDIDVIDYLYDPMQTKALLKKMDMIIIVQFD